MPKYFLTFPRQMDFFLLGRFILNSGAHLPVGLSTKHMCIEEKTKKQVFDVAASYHYFMGSLMLAGVCPEAMYAGIIRLNDNPNFH